MAVFTELYERVRSRATGGSYATEAEVKPPSAFMTALLNTQTTRGAEKLLYATAHEDIPAGVTEMCHAVENGLELPVEVAVVLAENGLARLVIHAFWSHASMFEDDSRYTNTRFVLRCREPQFSSMYQEPYGAVAAAVQQVLRMFEIGQANLAYVDKYRNTYESEFVAQWNRTWYAHDDEFTQMIQKQLDDRKRSWAVEDEQVQRLTNDLSAANRIRTHLFKTIWLRAFLTEAAYQALGKTPTSMLQDLYPEVWQGGYLAYYAQVQAKTNPVCPD